ncbi:hypothetical protein MSG28_005131 [Choristoneura fumiferana]|uniref:Uncharacterized protein n=1 Tax=Choristoneura fumiferana TaxID=7141 RepID=A0ACC0JPW8_CHOFU|nr:hypothetical protein MSG28_005131 [Choristoneura fumiferana]
MSGISLRRRWRDDLDAELNLLLEAKSGTGKTAVFTVIALEKINLNNGLQVVILAPTREIASQICDVIKQIGSKYAGLSVEVVMGGLPVADDIEKLKKNVHIIVASPGRLHHLIKDKHVDTSAVRLLVLDEADKLMEKSFRSDIDSIFSSLPQQKQVILSSATFPEDSKPFINKYVQLHQHICPDSNNVLLGISQKVTLVNHHTNIVRQTQYRFEELLNILSKKEFKQCLIFCNYQARVTDLYKMLKKAKWPAEKLYGQQEQTDRLEALKTLQEYKCRILIATDLAARGLDSSHVDLVVNFEFPREWQTYLHRIGRAGRFGSYGLAVTILSNKEEEQFKQLLNSLQFQIDIRNFWTDDKYEYSNFEAPETTEQTECLLNCHDDETSEKDTDLWDDMVSRYTISYKIETFDELCESLKEATSKTETSAEDSFHNAANDDTNACTEFDNQAEIINEHEQDMCNQDIPTPETENVTIRNNKCSKTTIKDNLETTQNRSQMVENSESKIFFQDDITFKGKCPTKDTKISSKQKKSEYDEAESERLYLAYVKDSMTSDESNDGGYNTASYGNKSTAPCRPLRSLPIRFLVHSLTPSSRSVLAPEPKERGPRPIKIVYEELVLFGPRWEFIIFSS